MTSQEFKRIRTDELHMTQQEFADELSTTRTSISRYECGRQALTPTMCRLLAYVQAYYREQPLPPAAPGLDTAEKGLTHV